MAGDPEQHAVPDHPFLLPATSAIDQRLPRAVQVYERIREAIVSLWFKPGEFLSEKAIAEQLGLSRTPVREALMRLADKGLVDIVPHSGTFVSTIKLQDVVESQVIREALELAALRSAAGKFTDEFEEHFLSILERQRQCARWNDYDGFHALDEEFHRTISECGATPKIWSIIITAKDQLDRVRRLGMRAPGQLQQIIAEHESIVRGLKAKDEAMASAALKSHLDEVFKSIQNLMVHDADFFSTDTTFVRADESEGRNSRTIRAVDVSEETRPSRRKIG